MSYHPDYFRLETLAEGVYAGIANREAGTVSNVGIVDLGETALVVDSFMLPQAAREIAIAVDRLIGKPVGMLVSTHSHDDHFIGNGVFPPETRVVSTHRNRELIAAYAQDFPGEKAEVTAMLADLQQQTEATSDDAAHQKFLNSITRFSRFLEAFDTIVVRPPDLTFEGRLAIHGARRRVDLLSLGAAHSPSDVIVHLPDDGIVFAGDAVLVRTHPYMYDSDPDKWRVALAQVEALPFETLVPGHGPVGTRADVGAIRRYLDAVEGIVRQVIVAGGTDDDAASAPVPAAFAGWSGGAYARNMRFLFDRLSGG